MRLDCNYKGGPLKFFLAFQNVYLDLENCTGKTVPDEKKIGALNASMNNSSFNSVCTTIETLALQTKTPINLAPPESMRATSYRRQGEVGREVEIKALGKINPGIMTTVHRFPRMSFIKYQKRRERSKQRLGQKQEEQERLKPYR
eukprot:15321968-Ditylum_brightwellii.AAC.1